MRGRANNHLVLRPRRILETPQSSTYTTPSSSNLASACPSSDEDTAATTSTPKPFPFSRLPSELRTKIYSLVFAPVPSVIDLDPSIFKLLQRTQLFALFRVSRQIYRESAHHFFSTHTVRIFPTYPGKYFKTKRPLLARLPARWRSSLSSLQLRVGPGWNNPPPGWVVNAALGLADCTSVRVLKVFVECDPSDAIFAGFRKSEGFYERFCGDLLEAVLRDVPSVQVVEFDAYSSVARTGDMMAGLGEVVARRGKVVAWGQERGWGQESEQVWLDAILMHGMATGMGMSKNVAVFA